MGLGDKGGDVHRHLAGGASGTSHGQVDQSLHVLLLLSRQAQHEVQFDLSQIVAGRQVYSAKHVVLGLGLVDHLPQSLRARLGGNGQRLDTRLGQGADQGLGDGIHAHGGHAEPRTQATQLGGQFVNVGVIGYGSADQAQTLPVL